MSKNRKRFTRDAVCSVSQKAKDIFFRYINPTNLVRLQKTLDLSDVDSKEKPCINSVMIPIQERIEEEERMAEESARRLYSSYGWSQSMIYDCMGEDYDEEYGMPLSAKQLKKLNKKLSKGKKRDKKVDYSSYDDDDYWENRKTMFTKGEWSDDDESNYEESYKKIKFYPDITNELSVIEFSSLKAFSDFCDDKGYSVGTTDYENLKYWGTIHCCLDPIDLEYGEYTIITDTSYGGLYWTVEPDLPDDVLHPELSGSESENK